MLLLVGAATGRRVILLSFSRPMVQYTTVHKTAHCHGIDRTGLDIACRRAKIWIVGQSVGQNSPSASEPLQTDRQIEIDRKRQAVSACARGYTTVRTVPAQCGGGGGI